MPHRAGAQLRETLVTLITPSSRAGGGPLLSLALPEPGTGTTEQVSKYQYLLGEHFMNE